MLIQRNIPVRDWNMHTRNSPIVQFCWDTPCFLKLKWAFSSLKQLATGDTNSKYARNEYLSQVTSYVVSWSPLFGCSLDRSFLDLNCTELNPVIWIDILLSLDNEHRLINPLHRSPWTCIARINSYASSYWFLIHLNNMDAQLSHGVWGIDRADQLLIISCR